MLCRDRFLVFELIELTSLIVGRLRVSRFLFPFPFAFWVLV